MNAPERHRWVVLTGVLLVALVCAAARGEDPPPGPGFGDVDYTYTHRTPGVTGNDRNIGNEIFYQIFVDRFFQGNPANAQLHEGRFSSPDRSDWQKFWGGDIRGIIEKIPYLKELGITRLWLTPILEPQLVQVENGGKTYGPYHGYWVRDMFRLNPFQTDRGNQDYAIVQELVDKAAPHFKVLLDSVMNHSSPRKITDESRAYLDRAQPLPPAPDGRPRSQEGALFMLGRYLTSYAEDVHRAYTEPGYERRYNHNPNITDFNDQYQQENFSLFDLSDYNMNNRKMARLLQRFHDFWMNRIRGLAGFRLDAVPNVPLTFWREFSQRLTEKYPGIEMVGEIFGGGAGHGHSETVFRDTQMTLFDFSFRNVIRDTLLHNQSFTKFAELWRRDPGMGDARPLVTFLDNHDVARLRGEGMTLERMRQGIGLLFASRGVPIIYYGLEQDLFHPGDPGDPFNRPMMEKFDTSHPLFKMIQTLTEARKANPAFRYGDTHMVHLTDHIMAFERLHGENAALFVTSKNPREGEDRFTLKGLRIPDGEYIDVLSGRTHTVRNGTMDVAIGNGGMIFLSTAARAGANCATSFSQVGH